MTQVQRATRMSSSGGRAFRADGRGTFALLTAEGIGVSRSRPAIRATLAEAVLLLLRPAAELATVLGRIGAENSVIVLRVLEIVFRRDAVA